MISNLLENKIIQWEVKKDGALTPTLWDFYVMLYQVKPKLEELVYDKIDSINWHSLLINQSKTLKSNDDIFNIIYCDVE